MRLKCFILVKLRFQGLTNKKTNLIYQKLNRLFFKLQNLINFRERGFLDFKKEEK
jgi:hypothetical protein